MKPFILPALFLTIIFYACQEQTKFIKSSDGTKIAYQVDGLGDFNLIFVHGWACDRSYWKYQVPYFDKRYKVISIDLAGHGDSGIDREIWSMAQFGDDVLAVVNKLKLKKYVLIGHSLGGLVVLQVASRKSDQVQAVVGVDIYRYIPQKRSQEELQKMLERAPEDFTNFKENTTEFVPSFFTDGSDSSLVTWVTQDMASNDPNAAFETSDSFSRFMNDEFINALQDASTIPIMAINSDRRETDTNGLRQFDPDLQIEIMAELGHFVMMEDPENFNTILEKFLTKLR